MDTHLPPLKDGRWDTHLPLPTSVMKVMLGHGGWRHVYSPFHPRVPIFVFGKLWHAYQET